MNAQRVNKFELPFYEELVNVRAKRYQLLLDMYADVQRSAALLHDSEYCAWQRLLTDRPTHCNCTAVHAGRLAFDGCQLPPVVPLPYTRYSDGAGNVLFVHFASAAVAVYSNHMNDCVVIRFMEKIQSTFKFC